MRGWKPGRLNFERLRPSRGRGTIDEVLLRLLICCSVNDISLDNIVYLGVVVTDAVTSKTNIMHKTTDSAVK